MDTRERHAAVDYAKVAMAFAAVVFALSFMVLVIWLATAEQTTKLYESDNVVCASQPFAMNCWERKSR